MVEGKYVVMKVSKTRVEEITFGYGLFCALRCTLICGVVKCA